MRSLVEVIGMPDSGLACLATATFPHLEVLGLATPASATDGLKAGRPANAGLRALAVAAGLPKLREIRLDLASFEWRFDVNRHGEQFERDATDYAWLFAAPFGAQLEALHVRYNASRSLTSWLGLVRTKPTLQRVVATGAHVAITITASSATMRPRYENFSIPESTRVQIREALGDLRVTET